jgi:ribonuclease J
MNYTRVIPVGGCGEIGLNLTAIESNGEWIFVDAGLLFPEERLLGIDFHAPDLSWFRENGVVPLAWLITHGHEDHIGALPYLYREFCAPIFAPSMAAEFIRTKFEEEGIEQFHLTVVEPFRSYELGDFFVTPVAMAHSIPDSCGYLVDTFDGKILVTGDFRVDSEFLTEDFRNRFHKAVAPDGVDLMLSDSTNAMVPGRDFTEDVVVEELKSIMSETTGKVVVVSFSSSIWRFRSVLEAAQKMGRGVYFLGRSMERNVEIARKLGLLQGLQRTIVDEADVENIPDGQLCVVASGSQGEVFSAAFRLAFGQVKNVKVEEGDTVVLSARTIPGNERAVSTLLNHFAKRKIRIITARDRTVHVSGHGFADDILDVLNFVKPRYFLPVHGQYRHLLANADLAVRSGVGEDNVFVLEDGGVLELRTGVCRRATETIETGLLSVSQSRLVEREIIRQRESMAYGGMVVVSFFLLRDGSFATPPRVVMKGVSASEERLLKDLPKLYEKALDVRRKKAQPQGNPEELVRTQVRRWVEQATGGVRAVVNVIIQRVE